MPSPFKTLGKKDEPVHFDEWAGQFSCMESGCGGWANIAKYSPSNRVLTWLCQEGHANVLEDMDE